MDELPILNPPEYPNCFVCGPDNGQGLGLVVRRDGESAVARYSPRQHEEGYPARFHGGLVGLLVDEMLVYAGAANGLVGMTARVSYRLRKPIPMDAELTLRGRLESSSSRGFKASVEIRLDDGSLAADGTGTCVNYDDLPTAVSAADRESTRAR